MAWNQAPRKVVSACAVSDMQFVKPSHSAANEDYETSTKVCRLTFDPQCREDRSLDNTSRLPLLAAVSKSVPENGLRQFWENSPHPFELQESNKPTHSNAWSEVIFQHDNAQKVDVSAFITPTMLDINVLMEQMTLDPCRCQEIEEVTRGQADSKLWLALHNGRVTSSCFGEILHRRENTEPESIVKQIMGCRRARGLTPAMRWVKDNEERARTKYVANQMEAGEVMTVRPTGLSLHPRMSYLEA